MQTAPDKQEYLLSIDNGTQSVRAMIFDRDGHLVAKSKVEIEPYFSTEPGWAEQHAEYFWQALCQACHKLWEQLEIPRESIKAMSVTTQRATVVAMGADGQPLRAAISWLDQRQIHSKPELGAVESLLMRAVGAKVAVDTFHTQAEANWIAEHEPELWQQVDKLLLLSGYHNYKLTGDYKDSVASQVGFIPFDFKQLQWAEAKDWKWRAIPSIKREMLPELVEAGGLLGHISSAAAAETGIPQGLPLIACGSDKACEVLGTGCLDSNTGSLSYGTTATFNITSDKYLEAIPFHPAYPGVIPGSFNVEMMVPRGYWMVSWFKQQFGLEEQSAAEQQGVTVESLFDHLLAAGSRGF